MSVTAYQLAQYLGAIGTAAFVIHQLLDYWRSRSTVLPAPTPVPIRKTQTTPTTVTPAPFPFHWKSTEPCKECDDKLPEPEIVETNHDRRVKAFAALNEIRGVLVDECGIAAADVATSLEDIAKQLMHSKGGAA